MSKHPRSPSVSPSHKRSRPAQSTFTPNKVASAAAAAVADADPPLPKLLQAVRDGIKSPAKGDCVVYWMRMADLRSTSTLLANSSNLSHSPGSF
jgi:deoxyribodipyrimidine photo-lyase